MYYEDLSSYCYYLKTPVSIVKNVGWLESDTPYNTGVVDRNFLPRFAMIILGSDVIDTEVNRIRSVHPCALADCDVQEIREDGDRACLGAAEIWVPSTKEGEFFAAPSMIYHYIEKHGYLPPKEYISAVMNFNFESSFKAQEAYLNAIKGHF